MSPDPPPSRPTLPVAVSALTAAVVGLPPVAATVVGVHRFALYLEVGGRILPVVTSDAVALPTAVRLAVRSGSVAWGVSAGDEVPVGGGRVVLPGLDLVVARTWRPARVRRVLLTPPGGEPEAVLGGLTGDRSGWLADGIRAALTDLEVGRAVADLVGRGRGLTPSGDDALAGALLVTRALGVGDQLADAVRARLGATTAVSAALLDAAADGFAAREVVDLVDAAAAGDAAAVNRALPPVLAIGHTSGADTVTGIRAALDALTHGETHTNGRSAA